MWNRLMHFDGPSSPGNLQNNRSDRLHGPTGTVLIFLAFALAGVLIAFASLKAAFFWDDLHLIRTHTPAELASAWHDTYDPDHMGPPDFRPLSMYFEHLRAAAFGESVVAHRLFLVSLFAAFLTLAGLLARELFDAGFWQIILGGLLALLHVDSVSHYLWPTDGIFLATGILSLGAILAFLRAYKSGQATGLVLAFVCAALALFTREDTLVVYPLMIWFGVFLAMRLGGWQSMRLLGVPALATFAAALVLLLGAFWWWRSLAVPDAFAPRVDLAALLWAAAHTVQNAGTADRLLVPWPRYEWMILVWYAWLAALAAAALVWLDRLARLAVLCWAVAILISAAPVMVVARANLLLLPVAFWGLLLAHVLTRLWSRAPTVLWRSVIAGLALVGLGLPAVGSTLFQQELRPNNLQWMCRNALILYDVTGQPTVPPARRLAIQQQLDAFGISGIDELHQRWQDMERLAQAEGRYGVNAENEPFIPRFEFLPQFRLHPRCEPPG